MKDTKDNKDIKIGDGATIRIGSDSEVGTIIGIKSPSRVLVQLDDVIQDGQGYAKEITQNKNNPIYVVIKGKKGWKVLNEPFRVTIGSRNFFYDLSF
jgi:hypothetical protein